MLATRFDCLFRKLRSEVAKRSDTRKMGSEVGLDWLRMSAKRGLGSLHTKRVGPRFASLPSLPATMCPLNLKRTQTKPAQPYPWLTTDHRSKPHLTGISLGITVSWKPVFSQDDVWCYYEKAIKEFPELFADKLPSRSH